MGIVEAVNQLIDDIEMGPYHARYTLYKMWFLEVERQAGKLERLMWEYGKDIKKR